MAQTMLARARAAGVPAAWVTGDEIYGGDRRLRHWLEEREQPFVLAVKQTEPRWAHTEAGLEQVTAAALAAAIPAADWRRLSAGDGAKGPRRYAWARVAIRPLHEPAWEHWLLVRRSLVDLEDLADYVGFAPLGTTLPTLVTVAGQRWAIEGGLEAAKGELGLDQYQVRRWPSWYRHITLALLAHAFRAVTRAATATNRGR